MIPDLLKRFFKLPSGPVDLLPKADLPAVVPLDAASPWPKFRGNPLQTGRCRITPGESGRRPWEFATGKGIFSSPVIDADGMVYIGSADHFFYAIEPDGKVKWQFATAELIDSSALLDDKGRIFFGSGDGFTYCLDRTTGKKIWQFAAHTPAQVTETFGIKTYNLNWFEGNIAMLPDGTILSPNDNYLVYGIDRNTGEQTAVFPANEMVWSCPAVNPQTGRIFFASCFNALINLFCYDGKTGKKIWASGGLGTVSASPLLTSHHPDGAVVVGGFDGILRAFSQKNGRQIWSFGTRDHIYGSPAQLSDGTLVQASCDGTLYGLDPETGRPVWQYDTTEPVRSSPVVDKDDQIYFGSGEGRLYCVRKDGSFKWAYQCIDGGRNDLNGSPALGPDGVCIAGENGSLFFVPYDWPLTREGRNDPMSIWEAPVQSDGSTFFYVNHFGRPMADPPEQIQANEPVVLVHRVRENGNTLLSAIDAKTLSVSIDSRPDARIALSADKKFITLIPKETWTGPEGGTLKIKVQCRIKTKLRRFGLKFFGGKKTHHFSGRFSIGIAPFETEETSMPYQIPQNCGDKGNVIEISRLTCPHPTLLPSYNQIGFDSLHYLAALVDGSGNRAVLWVVPGRLDETTGKTVADPSLTDIHVMEMVYEIGLLTLYNYDGFTISFVGAWDMPFGLYRMAARVDTGSGIPQNPAALSAVIRCDDIRFYGRFLKLAGMSDMKTGLMHICGGLNLSLWESGQTPPVVSGETVSLTVSHTRARAEFLSPSLCADDHLFGILMMDAGEKRPLALDYAGRTSVETNADGLVTAVTLAYDSPLSAKSVQAVVMVDTWPVFKKEV